jgi:SPP1 family predicted phage head-tail adaptor
MLTAAELTELRAVQALALPGTAIVERQTLVADGMGGQAETWSPVGTVAARLYPMSMLGRAEPAIGGQVQSITRWDLTLPHGTDVTAADRIRYGGRAFQITNVNNDEAYQTAVRCELIAYNELADFE